MTLLQHTLARFSRGNGGAQVDRQVEDRLAERYDAIQHDSCVKPVRTGLFRT